MSGDEQAERPAGPTYDCEIHGTRPWDGEVQCEDCGAAYTTKDPLSSMHAPPRCRKCGARLMPILDRSGRHVAKKAAGKYFSMRPCCSVCFAEAPGMAFQEEHRSGDQYCMGEECKYHGPQLRKLRRRAQRASSQTKVVEPAAPETFEMTVPGEGVRTFREV